MSAVVIIGICKDVKTSLIAFALLSGSYCFMCYSTAGLENSLLYFLSSLFIYVFFKNELFSEKHLFLLSLVLALLAWSRMDSVLLFIPLICYGYLFKTKVPFPRRVVLGIGGLLPFICWELFSVLYYGWFFPNTYYVKVCTGFPTIDYIIRGIDFVHMSIANDIFLGIGIVAYTLYVVKVGGDFMLGRHLTIQYLASVIGIIFIIQSEYLLNNITGNRIIMIVSFVIVIALAYSTTIKPIAAEKLSYTGT